jgi:hypothetical protein
MADIVGANAPRNKRPLVGHANPAPLLGVMIRLNVVACDEALREGAMPPSFATVRQVRVASGPAKGNNQKKMTMS